MRPGIDLGDLQGARSVRLLILESPKLSSEVSESKGRELLRSHLYENSTLLVKKSCLYFSKERNCHQHITGQLFNLTNYHHIHYHPMVAVAFFGMC